MSKDLMLLWQTQLSERLGVDLIDCSEDVRLRCFIITSYIGVRYCSV